VVTALAPGCARSIDLDREPNAIVLGNLALASIRQRHIDTGTARLHEAIDVVEGNCAGGGLNVVFAAARELQPWRNEPVVQVVHCLKLVKEYPQARGAVGGPAEGGYSAGGSCGPRSYRVRTHGVLGSRDVGPAVEQHRHGETDAGCGAAGQAGTTRRGHVSQLPLNAGGTPRKPRQADADPPST
jgi:hypothetical protein